MTDGHFDTEKDSTNRSVESEAVHDSSSSENRVDSASVDVTVPSDSPTAAQGVESGGRSAVEGSLGSESAEGNVSGVNNRGSGESNNEVSGGVRNGAVNDLKPSQKKVKRRRESKSKESGSLVYDSMTSKLDECAADGSVATEDRSSMGVSPVHGFEVGDMVWGKVKSHPWWPGHIFSEKFATVSVRRSKGDGRLLVAFFGDSSYGWFHPSELIPFDSNFAEKSRQTNSKTFIKAVEEAMDEVSRRSALGLSCMCRNKQNFRPTDVKGYFAVDVVDYEPGAVYSIDAIAKARDSFQPSSALDFVRRLALEPTNSDYGGVEFVKNKAKVVSYRRAIYEEFDETYAQAFGYDPGHSSSGSSQEPAHQKTPSKAPLSGRQVFADTSGTGKGSAKPNKPKDLAKKDKYLFKRRDEPKEVKTHPKKEKNKVKIGLIEDEVAVPADNYILQKRVPETTHDDVPLKDSDPVMEGTPVVLEFKDPDFQTNKEDDDKTIVSQIEDKKSTSDSVVDKTSVDKTAATVTQNEILSSGPHKITASENIENGPKKVKASKRPIGETGPTEKKKKRKKEQLMSDGTGKVVVKKLPQSSAPPTEDMQGPDNSKPVTSHASGSKDITATGPADNETELPTMHRDLLLLALDPFNAVNRGRVVKSRQVFLRFRSLVFQKSLNITPAAEDDEGNGSRLSKSSENGTGVTLVKSQPPNTGKSDDPTKGGRKRAPSDRQEDMAARKKKKVVDIKNLTKEKKVAKMMDEPAAPTVRQPVVKKPGPEMTKKSEQRAPPEPTMLIMKFPPGGSLPSNNELKARFARFGPMDHSATRIFWKTFSCRVVYWHKANALAARKFVVGSSSLFGNTNVKCMIREVEVDEPVKVSKEEQQPGMEDRGVRSMVPQPKSILKKSGGEEAGGSSGRGRVKFMLGGEENQVKNSNIGASSYSKSSTTTHSTTMDINSKNFQKAVLQSANPLPPLLPLPTTTSVITSTTQFTRPPLQPPQLPPPPPNSMPYVTPLAPPPPNSMPYVTSLAPPPPLLPPPPPRLPPPPSLIQGGGMAAKPPVALSMPNIGHPKVDISQQMLSLLTKCNEVVGNVRNVFGYVPYRPL